MSTTGVFGQARQRAASSKRSGLSLGVDGFIRLESVPL